jgi:hypothetical protein
MASAIQIIMDDVESHSRKDNLTHEELQTRSEVWAWFSRALSVDDRAEVRVPVLLSLPVSPPEDTIPPLHVAHSCVYMSPLVTWACQVFHRHVVVSETAATRFLSPSWVNLSAMSLFRRYSQLWTRNGLHTSCNSTTASYSILVEVRLIFLPASPLPFLPSRFCNSAPLGSRFQVCLSQDMMQSRDLFPLREEVAVDSVVARFQVLRES